MSKSRSAARRLDLLSIAAELFQHRSEATEFPVSLTDLKSLPKHDDGRAGPIVYRRVESGFELMSGIEPNLTKLSYDGKQSLRFQAGEKH